MIIESLATITLFHCPTKTECQASLVKLTRDLASKKVDGRWWHLKGVTKKQRKVENDHGWRWVHLLADKRNNLKWEFIAAQTADQEVQGAMSYRIDTKSLISSELGTLYVDRLATAPRNRPWLVGEPQFKGVGSGMLLRAVCDSFIHGFEGRTTLSSAPDEKTLQFYRNRGFEEIKENEEEGTIDCELPGDAAVSWLREVGII